jgi:alkane 1-monooxygenase
MNMQALQFSAPFGFLLSIPVMYGFSPAAPLLAPLAILVVLLVTEQIGRDSERTYAASRAFRLLPILYISAQLAVIVWALEIVASDAHTFEAFASLAISVGACAGVFGMLAAHEMVHSRLHQERRLGMLMLFGMSYPHFRIAHLHGHHRYAAMERDASTARFGESFYGFLLRTIPAQILIAWSFERRRTHAKPAPLLHNRVIVGALLLAVAYGALLIKQPICAAFFATESAVAILVLELFNYVAHYGLVRHVHGGTVEPLAEHHSWNSPGLGNILIFNMGRHSDHHRNPANSYEGLHPVPAAPELPFGYAGAILLALVPALWRAAMDHRVKRPAAKSRKRGYSGESPAATMP